MSLLIFFVKYNFVITKFHTTLPHHSPSLQNKYQILDYLCIGKLADK